jgi:hypothetical protein
VGEETKTHTPRLRDPRETGFPWNVQTIDRTAQALRGTLRLTGVGDYAAQVDAWRVVASEHHPATPVGRDDSVAFVDWFNALAERVASTGQQAQTIAAIHAALEAVCEDATVDPLIAAALPDECGVEVQSLMAPRAAHG